MSGLLCTEALARLDRKYTHAALALFNNDQRARFQIGFMLTDRRQYEVAHVIRQHVFTSNLQDVGARLVSQGKQRAEVEVVSENDMTIRFSPIHEIAIRGVRIAYRGPVCC